MNIKECLECLEILLHSLEPRISSEEYKTTVLNNIKPSSFEFVIKNAIHLLNCYYKDVHPIYGDFKTPKPIPPNTDLNTITPIANNDFKDFCVSDAEVCKACKNKDTEVCLRCSHFPF